MNLVNVFSSIFTLFIVGIVGYYCRRREILGEEAVKSLPRLLLEITFPCMIISSMQIPYTSERFNDFKTIFIISILAYGFSILLSLVIPKVLRVQKEGDKGVFQFMTVFSNVSFIGFPVLLSIFPKEVLFYASIYNVPFNLLVFTLGIYLMQSKLKTFDMKLFLNPSLVSLAIGFVLFYFSIKLPHFLVETLELIGSLTTPLSMIFIGASLSNIDIKKIFTDWRLYAISIIRLLFVPLSILFILRFFIQDPLLLGIPVIISGMPVAANCAIIANQYGGNSDLASEGIFMSTLLSMITIPILVLILSVL